MPSKDGSAARRALIAAAAASLLPRLATAQDRRWFEAADAMRKLALSWGDQDYGAVLVLGDAIVGEGPSRVVKNNDPSAHAEREAIRDAQKRLGRSDLAGAVLYSTSRPCPLCRHAAAEARVSRMYFGPQLTQETSYLLSVPGMRESIKEGMAEPLSRSARTLPW